ncbi:MAG: hypothetical protein ACHWZW_13105 [Spirulina sp.]
MNLESTNKWIEHVNSFPVEFNLDPTRIHPFTLELPSSISTNNKTSGVGAILLGKGITEVHKQAEELAATKPEERPWENSDWLDKFSASPANGLASILGFIQHRVNWNPIRNSEATRNNFSAFINLLSLSPYLAHNIVDKTKVNFKNKDYPKIIDEILSLYTGLSPEQMQDVKTNLRQMVYAALSEAGSQQTNTLFVQNIMEVKTPDIIAFYVYSSKVSFIYHGGKHHFMETHAIIDRIKLIFDASKVWNRTTAAIVSGILYNDVNQWLENNNAPDKQSIQPTIDLCF